jgi:hypothetical protein
MDFAQAKARLVRQSRETFGEKVTIRPMKAGELKRVADPDRAVMTDIAARFDYALEPVKLGGSDRTGPLMPISEDNPSFSIPRELLSWDPRSGDVIERASGERCEIVRAGDDGAKVALFFVSRGG